MPPKVSSKSSRPRRRTRILYGYDESGSEIEPPSPPTSSNSRPTRVRRRVQSYKDESTDDQSDQSDNESDTEEAPENVQLGRQLQVRTPAYRNKPTKPASHTKLSSFKRRKVHRDINEVKPVQVQAAPIIPTGKIPPWQTLPYEILQSIMTFAAYPFYKNTSTLGKSVQWLVQTSFLCHSFYDACMAALLYSPPMFPTDLAQHWTMLLSSDQSTLSTNYQTKVKSLEIEVKHLLMSKNGINIDDLISHTPLLRKLRLHHFHDEYSNAIWAQPEAAKDRWPYPRSLFDTFDQHNIVLKSFEWNGRFPRPAEVIDFMSRCHTRPCLARVQEISLFNLSFPEKIAEDELSASRTLLISALHNAEYLSQLSFRNCTIADAKVIPALPAGLKSLSFTNCLWLTSAALELYLVEHGRSLESLTLVGNQVMSLSFTSKLKETCPNLQYFHVDLTYTDATSYRDREPLFDDLLPDGPPTWPSSLIEISLDNLRNFSIEDAEGLFASLINAAPSLPYLKKLGLKSILDCSWRDRARLRKDWQTRFEQVFLRRWTAPKPLTSFPKPSKAERAKLERQKSRFSPKSKRASNRIAENRVKKQRAIDSAEDTDSASLSSMSLNSRHSATSTGIDDSKLPRQGLCTTVYFSLSYQRPAQEMYTENDFLDEDRNSDDREWTGRGGGGQAREGYAW